MLEDQHHVISWPRQCNCCHWPDRWCKQCHWCASGIKPIWFQARNCNPFSASRNQSATTACSWLSCREVEYHRHLLPSPRGMWINSYWDGDSEDGHTCSLWRFSTYKSKIQDVAAPKDVDQHGDSTDQYKLSPPCQLQWSGNRHVCFSNTTTSSQWFAPHLPFDWVFSSASYQSCDWSPQI